MHDEPDPGANYPPECAQWMERTMERAAVGDIPGYMEMQERANEYLREHALPTLVLPDEYYELQIQAQEAQARGDRAEVKHLLAETERILAQAGVPADIKRLA